VIQGRQGEDDEQYVVGHSSRVVAFGIDGRAHVLYPVGTRQADWVHDLPKLVEEGAARHSPGPARLN
jgi:cytochrome oxidase Cu insertion factor (SCO1/SenC/PrrC family)